MSNPFYRYDPDQCILCGRCVEACQNLQVNETLTHQLGGPASARAVGWRRSNQRVELRFVRALRHGLPVQCADGKIDAGRSGLLYRSAQQALNGMIDVVKGHRAGSGLRRDHAAFEDGSRRCASPASSAPRQCAPIAASGCSFDIWTRDRHILKVEPAHGPANGVSTCIKGKFGWDFVNSPDRLTKPLIREGGGFREASWDEALDLVARRFSEIKSGARARRAGFHLFVEVHQRRELPDAEAGAGRHRHQ